MTVWMVILLIALVLSPLTWLIPSRGQRGQMDLRLQARRLGLAMQIARQEWPHWMERQPPRQCAQYHRARGRNRDVWCYWQSEPGVWLDRWREASATGELAEALAGSEEVHSAFVEQLFHYLVKQPIRAFGPGMSAELRRSFAEDHFQVRRLLVDIIAASALRPREGGL